MKNIAAFKNKLKSQAIAMASLVLVLFFLVIGYREYLNMTARRIRDDIDTLQKQNILVSNMIYDFARYRRSNEDTRKSIKNKIENHFKSFNQLSLKLKIDKNYFEDYNTENNKNIDTFEQLEHFRAQVNHFLTSNDDNDTFYEQIISEKGDIQAAISQGSSVLFQKLRSVQELRHIVLVLLIGLVILTVAIAFKVIYLPLLNSFFKEYREKVFSLEELAKTERRMEVGHWVYDVKSGETIWSEHIRKLYEQPERKILKFNEELKLYAEEDREKFQRFILDAISSGDGFSDDFNFKTLNGRNKWVEIIANVEMDEDGEPNRISATFKDITQLKTAQNRFDTLFNTSLSPYFILYDGKIIDCNNRAVKLLDAGSKEDLLNQHLATFSAMYQMDGKATLDKLGEIIEKAYANEEFRGSWIFKKKKTGEDLLVDINSRFIEMNEKIGVLISCNDSSEKLDYERRLLRANSKAQEAMRMRAEFLATISNEIRGPFDRIMKNSQKLHVSDVDAETSSVVENIISDCDFITRTIDDIISFSKVEMEASHIEYYSFDIIEQVKLLIKSMNIRAEEKNIRMFSHLPKLDRSNFKGDPVRIRQVIYNLLENAIKYSGGKDIEISLIYNKKNQFQGEFLFTIRDHGVGMKQDKIDKLFAVTSLLERSKLQKEMKTPDAGLSISKFLSDLMGAEIWAESEPGKGSTFYFKVLLDEDLDKEKPGETFVEGRSRHNHVDCLALLRSQYKGDEDVLVKIIDDFKNYCPIALAAIKEAIEKNNAEALEVAAASFYGVLGNFHSESAIEKVIELEKMGQFNNLEHADTVYVSLKKEIVALIDSLDKINLSDLVA